MEDIIILEVSYAKLCRQSYGIQTNHGINYWLKENIKKLMGKPNKMFNLDRKSSIQKE